MSLPQKILFTAVFTIYWFIFYGISYYGLAWYDPTLLKPPAQLSQGYAAAVIAVFTAVVVLAYLGASFVVLGRLPGSPEQPTRGRGRETMREAVRSTRSAAARLRQKVRPARPGGQAARPENRRSGPPAPGRQASRTNQRRPRRQPGAEK